MWLDIGFSLQNLQTPDPIMAGVQSGGSSQLQQGSITGDARKVTGKTLGGSGNDRKVDGGKIKVILCC